MKWNGGGVFDIVSEKDGDRTIDQHLDGMGAGENRGEEMLCSSLDLDDSWTNPLGENNLINGIIGLNDSKEDFDTDSSLDGRRNDWGQTNQRPVLVRSLRKNKVKFCSKSITK